MNELVNGAVTTGFMAALVAVGLIVWFFINRASVRANRQIRLLEALLEEQKRQNALLRDLTDAVTGKANNPDQNESDSKDFTRLIPER